MNDPRTQDPTLQHLPPQSLEAEEALLSAILIDNTVLEEDGVDGRIGPDDFYKTAHQKIFRAMLDLRKIDFPVDLVTLTAHLRALNQIEEIGGASYLARLMDVPAASHPGHYARIIRNKSDLRRLIQHSSKVVQRCYECHDDIDGVGSVIDFAQAGPLEIGQGLKTERAYRVSDFLDSVVDQIDDAKDGRRLVSGMSTGFTDLDHMTSGLQKSDLIVVAARPSMGKTTLVMNIARNVAVDSGVPVAVFSLEMPKEQLAMRMLSAESRVNFSRLKGGYLTADEWRKITDAACAVNEYPIFIDDERGLKPSDICRRSRRMKRENNIGLIVVDYLQLMRNDKDNTNRRDLEIRDSVLALRDLAKELNVPLILISQLNRELEKRQEKRPVPADLRDGGAIEESADIIAFVYRQYIYMPDSDTRKQDFKNVSEIIFAKQRNGPPGTKPLAFFGEYCRFENMARRQDY